MNQIVSWVARRLGLSRPEGGSTDPMRMIPRMLGQTRAEEISCDEAFELLDRYAELVQSGQDAAALLPLVHLHIQICADCREELQALLRAIKR